MFKNETERAFVLVILMCGFIGLWVVVSDLAFGGLAFGGRFGIWRIVRHRTLKASAQSGAEIMK